MRAYRGIRRSGILSSMDSSAPAALVMRAPAKINLTLDVLGKRPDGYHALRSVMQALDWHDTLQLEPVSDLLFDCDVPALAGDANLVPRAARLLQEETGCARGARLTLRKGIPVEAGLGGGSSDAAASLLGLNRLWDLGLPPTRLAELGARLGSDVPFFLYAPTALVSGRGEVVEALTPPPAAHVVLHKPAIGVSTARVFRSLQPGDYGDGLGTERLVAALRAGAPPEEWPLSNGLQEAAAALYPEVAAALRLLRRAGAPHALMTGSGSTVYALFARESDARSVYDRLRADGHGAVLTRTATAGPLSA